MKKSPLKKLSLLLACLMLLGVLGACGNGGDANTQPPSAGTPGQAGGAQPPADSGNAPEPVNLTIMWWGPQNRHDATLAVMDLYMDLNPHITFTPEYLSWDGFWTKLPVLAASNSLPDVLQMDAAYIDIYTSKNQLADIGEIEADLKAIVDPGVVDNLKINDVLYTIPLSANSGGIAYNKVDLESYGAKLPFAGWTWDEFWAWAEETKPLLPSGVYPTWDMTNAWGSYNYYQYSVTGQKMFENDELFIDKDLWFAFMQRYAQYREQGIVPTAEESLSFIENDPVMDVLGSRKVMTRSVSGGDVSVQVELLPNNEVTVVNSPAGAVGAGWAQATIFWTVSANSTHKKEALDFAMFFISDLEAGKELMTVRGLPLSQAVYDAIEPLLTPGDLIGKDLFDVAVANKPMPFAPAPASFSDFTTTGTGVYPATMEKYMFGMITLEEAYDILITAANELTAAAKSGQ